MRLFAALLAALAATSAPAKPAAQLFVTALDTRPGAAAETDVDLTLPRAASSIDVYVPPGYAIDLDARAGTVIGSARTTVASSLVVGGPALWKAAGLTVAVDRADDGGYRLAYRLAQPVREVDLDILHGLTNPPTGVVTWRAIAGGFEARSIVAFPQVLTARATLARGALRASGKLLAAGKPRPGVNVHLAVATRDDLADARELGVARTRTDGSYAFAGPLARRTHLTLIAYVNFYAGPDGQSIAPPPSTLVSIR